MNGGTKLKTFVIISIFLPGMMCTTAVGRTIYVDDDGPADFNNIQAAIDDSNDGDTIIAADGTYTGEGNRDIGFLGKSITVRSENGPENCIIDVKATQSDWHNAFCLHEGENKKSTIDGFTITGGYTYLGGGIQCDSSSPTIKNCIIMKNTAGWGGGIMLQESNASVIHCIISNNKVWDGGGGIFNQHYSTSTINSCTITGNKAAFIGGILCYRSKASVNNCVVRANRSWYESEVRLNDSSISISYCDITGGESSVYVDETSTLYWGAGNIDADPCFGEPGYWDANGTPEDENDDFWVDGDYHLKSQASRWNPNTQSWVQDEVTSPCIDAGDPLNPIGLEPFPNGGRVNMGAYGGTVEASKSYFGQPLCETIVAGDINGDCIVNFKDFALMALHWLEDSNLERSCIVEDDVKYCIRTDKSVYHPGETVGIFYSITNTGGEPVSLGWAPIRPFCYRFAIVDANDEHVWLWSWEMPPIPPVMFALDAYESAEYEIGWDIINDNGTYETEDDFPAGAGNYKISGELLIGSEEDRVRVSVYVNVRE
jgi:FlaG/FlaF family flagellin (archaellin)